MAAQVGIAGSTKVENNCVFGGQAGISGHTTIGAGSKIGPQAGIISNVTPGSTLLGTPATEVRAAMKSFAVIKNLPELRNEVIRLEKRITQLEEKNK
jgi:UDP-3-O-[3-hydroxymyristoyl] glucosamine N-acyltransferase